MMGASDELRFCVITPYYKEDRHLLERCLISVRNQTVPADHIFVADGFPQDWLDQEPIRHVKLDRAHADYGDVARGIASLMAVSEKYDGIAFLDADNWFDDDHLSTCLEASASNPMAPYVIAQRNFARPDGSIMPIKSAEDFPKGDHVDTNCYFFYRHPTTYCISGARCRENCLRTETDFFEIFSGYTPQLSPH